MPFNPRFILAAVIMSFGVTLATTSASHAQAINSCAATMYRFDGVGPTARETLPSVRRQIAWLGLAAKRAECRLRITCAQASQADDDKREAARVCRNARTALLLNWQHAGNKTFNDALLKEVGLRYVPVSGNNPFGTVFVQLLP